MIKKLKDLYSELYNTLSNNPAIIPIFRFNGDKSNNPYAHFVAIKGDHFDANEKKLMLIGRAVNGWDSLESSSSEAFSTEADNQFFNKGPFNEDRWNWIDVDEETGVLYSGHDKDKSNRKNRYCLDQSAFWTYTREIWNKLPGSSFNTGAVWMKNIAWSNLYKVSPKDRGNPAGLIQNNQLKICREILTLEISSFKPTHILLMTGYDWFEPFKSCFSDCQYRGTNHPRGKKANQIYVEGTARFERIPVVITCRPERRRKEQFVDDVIKAFNTLTEL